MQNITNKLNNSAELWGMVPFTNELLEQDVKEDILKQTIYCNILPSSAVKQNTPITEAINFTHKFTVRALSIKEPKLNMFFIFKGQKHQFKSWNPDYKNNEFLEVFTELILE